MGLIKKHFKQKSKLKRRQGIYGLIFVSPFILGLLGVFIPAIIQSMIYSVSRIDLSGGYVELAYSGFNHYHRALFIDPEFVRTLVETISRLVFDIVVVILYALFIAVILNQKMRGRTLIRAIFFVPVILATGVMSQVESQNALAAGSAILGQLQQTFDGGVSINSRYAEMFGLLDITSLIANLRLPPRFIGFIFNSVFQIYDIIKFSGVQMLIFLAGLQAISPSIYEAAKVEGCSGWENFWKITLPLISPLIAVATVWTIVESFLNPANPIMQLIFGTAFSRNTDFSLAAAMAWINFIAMAVVVIVVMIILRKTVFYENE